MKVKTFFKSNFFLSAFAGSLCSAAFAPFHFFIAAIVSLSFFYFLLEKVTHKKEIFFLGFCYGFGYFLSGVYWIAISLLVDAQFFWLIPFALTLIPGALAAYFGLFALSYKFFIARLRCKKTYKKTVIFACCWLLFEVLRSNLFSGFPWNLLGYIWMFDVTFAQLAKVFGIYGLSFFAVLICLFPVLFFESSAKKLSEKIFIGDKIFAAILIIFFVGNFVYGYTLINQTKLVDDKKIKLRLVQGNIGQEIKWNAEKKYQNFSKHVELTNSKNLDDVSAVIWSETAVPYVIDDNPELLEQLRLATPPQGVLITGGLKVAYKNQNKSEISQAWNSVFVLNKNGVIASYDKHHLVPFGEYIPLQKYFPFIEKITEGAIGFSKGQGAKTVVAQGFSFSPLVCYEVIFSNETLNRSSSPDLLVNLTNDAWFGNSSGPYQHFDIARMRSIEYGISMARVANTGITAFIDPFGRVVEKIDLGQNGTVDIFLIKRLGATIYEKHILLPLLVVVVLLLFLIIF